MWLARSHFRSRCRSCCRTHSQSRLRLKRLQSKCQQLKWSLVPRYSSEMNIWWKYSILLIMTCVTLLHFLTTYCIKTILNSRTFGNVCFLSRNVYRPETICHCLTFIPICTAIVSMFWVQMFYMCGRGGYTFLNRHIDEEPWRIVIPSVVCFAGVTIIQFVYVVLLHIHITFYCNDVRGDFPEHRAKSCEYLIDLDSKVSVAWHYRTVFYSAMMSFLLWLGATVIMMVRVLRAPDFKVVIDKQRKVKLDPGLPLRAIEDDSKEKLIFINEDSPLSRSVQFK